MDLHQVSDLPFVTKNDHIVIDTETSGLDKLEDTPFLVTIRLHDKSYALRISGKLIEWLSESMPVANACVFHNAKFDLHMLSNVGLPSSAISESNVWCTKVTETLINTNNKSYTLDDICQSRFGTGKSDKELLEWLASIFGGKPDRKHQMKHIQSAPIDMVAKYAIVDVELTERLYLEQLNEVMANELGKVHDLEMKVTKALTDIERRGVPINMDEVKDTYNKFMLMKNDINSSIRELVGMSVNTRSGKQMEKAYTSLGLKVDYKSDTGNPIFDKESLERYGDELSMMVLEERSYRTMMDTFLSKFSDHVRKDDRIHCDLNQTKMDNYGVVTGRLSASNPNLQQIPKRNEGIASRVRGVFKAPNGCDWVSADWKQFEFRVFAHYSKDENLIKRFHDDPEADYHQIVSDLTGLDRNPYAKQLNLGLVFGMGQGLMAKKCGLKCYEKEKHGKKYLEAGKEAKAIFSKYHDNLPGIAPMLKMAENVAKRRGYVKTIMGRRISFENQNSTYKAAGYVFQGTSADLMKLKLVEINDALKNTNLELVLPVHDEFDFISHGGTEKEISWVKEIMEDMPMLRVPIRVDIGQAKSWWEASK